MQRARLIRMLEKMNQISLLNEIWSVASSGTIAIPDFRCTVIVRLPNACYLPHSIKCTDVKMRTFTAIKLFCPWPSPPALRINGSCFQPAVHMAKRLFCLFCFSAAELPPKLLDICQAAQMGRIWANSNDSHFHGKWKFHCLNRVSWSDIQSTNLTL